MSKATIFISGIIGNGDGQFSLKNVISQYKAFENPTEAEFIIDSVGGSVEVGESIGKYIENLDIPTTTIAVKAYSIAASIFMSAETRLIEDTAKPFMCHLPLIPEFGGRKADFQAAADYLDGLEKRFVAFYTSKVDLDKDTIYSLLSAESFLSGQEAVTMGFATGIRTQDFKAVAFHDETKTNTKMTNETLLKKIANALGLTNEDKPEVVALQLTDANGDVVDFPELEEGDTPEVGSKAVDADGKKIEGERIMPTLENAAVRFEDGAITEIVPAEEEVEETEEVEAVAAEIAEVSKWEISVVQESFELGTKVEYKPMEEGDEPTSVGAGEYELEDGRKILTDSEGVIRFIKEVEGTESTEEAPSDEEDAQALADQIVAKAVEAVQAKLDAQAVEMTELKKLIGSKEVDVKAQETNTKKSNGLSKSAQILGTLNKK